MRDGVIGVGLIGASAKPGAWAARAHVPAIRLLPEFELRAIATSSAATAELAGQVHGVENAYGDYRALLDRSDVSLVVVSVRVPMHREIIHAALDARKVVLSDWPLGADAQEAAELADRAAGVGVRNFVMLQGRFSPEIAFLRDLVAQGYLGEVISTSLVGSALGWGPRATESVKYMYDASAGVTMLTVAAMHNFEAFRVIFGDIETIASQIRTRQPTIIVDGGATIRSTAPDHVAMTGTFAGDVFFNVLYRGGRSRGENLRWDIKGTHGEIVVTGAHAGNLANVALQISAGRTTDETMSPIEIPQSDSIATGANIAPQVANVARLYRQLAIDYETGTGVVPDFRYATERSRVVEMIKDAGRTGQLVRVMP